MSSVVIWLGAAGSLLALAAIGGGAWATWKSAGLEATVKRLRSEIADYLSRLNYIEPRLEVVERENKTLLALHNSAGAIQELKEQEAKNHEATFGMLAQLHRDLVKNGERRA